MLANEYSCEVLEQECIGEWGREHETLVERGIVWMLIAELEFQMTS